MNESISLRVVFASDVQLPDGLVGEQELALVGEFLPELLKEMIWQTSQAEE